ncbi:MAG: hypothetical protein IPN76_26150 [Saprospiraceae bacterium]|nr:hypothetical protein [Saprospiraceae bacterium]
MEPTHILDATETPTPLPPTLRYQKAFLFIEGALALVFTIGALLKLFGTDMGMLDNYTLLVSGSLLMLLYLFGAAFVFGSVGWKRHIGAHLCGLAMMTGVAAILFKLERFTNPQELAYSAQKLLSIAAIIILILAIFRRNDPPKQAKFFWLLFARLTVLGLIVWIFF